MATTNFNALTTEQKQVWARDIWRGARQNSFIMNLSGTGPNAAIQRITELTESERGTRAVVTMVTDLANDGVMGDSTLEGNEEAINAYDQVVEIDQIRAANREAGRMASQGSVVRFRETSRDVLSFWLADRMDQLAALTLGGRDYRFNTDGSLRPGFSHNGTTWSRDTNVAPVGQSLFDLTFASDVTAPSANRYFRWDGTNKRLVPGDTTAITTADTLSYAALVELKAFAKNRRLRPVRAGGGMDVYHVFLHPMAMAKLKLDPDFLSNLRSAGQRGNSNPLFSGSLVTVDGLVLHEFTHCFNTLGATSGAAANAGTPGYKWGANADVDGSQVLLIGAQALAYCDLGAPSYFEWDFDYGNQHGISISKITGFKKPVFQNIYDGSAEDFGVITMDVAI